MTAPFVFTAEIVAQATPLPAAIGPTERVVIALAARDGRATLRGVGRLARWIDRLTGAPRKTPLADPRLEALRRFAVRCWHGEGCRAGRERRALDAAGFLARDVFAIVAELGGARAACA